MRMAMFTVPICWESLPTRHAMDSRTSTLLGQRITPPCRTQLAMATNATGCWKFTSCRILLLARELSLL